MVSSLLAKTSPQTRKRLCWSSVLLVKQVREQKAFFSSIWAVKLSLKFYTLSQQPSFLWHWLIFCIKCKTKNQKPNFLFPSNSEFGGCGGHLPQTGREKLSGNSSHEGQDKEQTDTKSGSSCVWSQTLLWFGFCCYYFAFSVKWVNKFPCDFNRIRLSVAYKF